MTQHYQPPNADVLRVLSQTTLKSRAWDYGMTLAQLDAKAGVPPGTAYRINRVPSSAHYSMATRISGPLNLYPEDIQHLKPAIDPAPGLLMRSTRKALNMNQQQFGELIGCPPAHVSRCEKGARLVPDHILSQLRSMNP